MLIEHPNIVEDFFGICRRYLILEKKIFFGSNQQTLESVMSVLIKGVGLEHQESASAHCKFMVDLLNEIRGDVKDGLNLDSVSLISLS